MLANKSFVMEDIFLSYIRQTTLCLIRKFLNTTLRGKCLPNKMGNNGIAFKTGIIYHLKQVVVFTVNLSSECNFSQNLNPEKLTERRFKCNLNIQTAFPVRGI